MTTKVHPAANIFPMLDGPAYEALKADIFANGVREPIVNYRGQLLDGRNRLKACKELGIEPMEAELDEDTDPVAYVLSANLHRRHLLTSQRAMCAAKLAGLPVGANQHTKQGVSNDAPSLAAEQAADLFGVGRASVFRALDVLRNGSAYLIEQCEIGEIAVSLAAKLVDAVPEKKKQTTIVKRGEIAIQRAIMQATDRRSSSPSAENLIAEELRRLPEDQREGCFADALDKFGDDLVVDQLSEVVDLWVADNEPYREPDAPDDGHQDADGDAAAAPIEVTREPFDQDAVLAESRKVWVAKERGMYVDVQERIDALVDLYGAVAVIDWLEAQTERLRWEGDD